MNLGEYQRTFKDAVLGRRPAGSVELGLRTRAATRAAVEYHRYSHWHKAIGSFALVFVSLHRELGAARFERVVRAHLARHPLRGSNPYQDYCGLIAHLQARRAPAFLVELCRFEWEKLLALQVPEPDDAEVHRVCFAPKVWLRRSRWDLARYYGAGERPKAWSQPRWQLVRWEASGMRFMSLSAPELALARRIARGVVEVRAVPSAWLADDLVLAPTP